MAEKRCVTTPITAAEQTRRSKNTANGFHVKKKSILFLNFEMTGEFNIYCILETISGFNIQIINPVRIVDNDVSN